MKKEEWIREDVVIPAPLLQSLDLEMVSMDEKGKLTWWKRLNVWWKWIKIKKKDEST